MKSKLRYLVIITTLALLNSLALANCSKVYNEEPLVNFVERNGRLSVQGTKLVNQKGEEIMLRGVSLSWHNWWPRFYNKETIGWLNKDWNCNLVRAAIGVEPDGALLKNPEFAYEKLYTVIDAAIQNGMYVIVDWHSHHIYTDDAMTFFSKVATKYKNVPNILYEIYNEPERDSWEEVKKYAETIIQSIRSIDSSAVILVGNPHWCQDIHLVADDPIRGQQNIMYTVHFYAATHKQFLRDRIKYALNKQIPIFVSECAGMEATGNGFLDVKEWSIWQQFMTERKISWVAWSLSDKNETCSMIKDTNSPHMNWQEADLKPWGTLIRNSLKNIK
ncbi:glycoside hydrolase family 5 protein [Sphingobacterium bovistauri]|uniref:Glycoside hydrolase family 5 protein n=1 Tax=Sphingobacterium bovistauri TaxID=2781959 RepID=A0ABS7Z6V9_9SPHI|nr:glycoside hydrolase family 5 protein [Sphingobacterium bovistauri]MCA5005156.1 glycoside hydrolase family 5 protein [Sphingobacterium bovistauri]